MVNAPLSDKEKYLQHWGITGPEAEEEWARKCAMDRGVKFLPCPMVFVSPDVCYDSPIDGRPITNMQARREDLARNNCIEYDPEMKKDAERRRNDQENTLFKSIETDIERQVETLPSRKKEQLCAELQGGLTAEVVRN